MIPGRSVSAQEFVVNEVSLRSIDLHLDNLVQGRTCIVVVRDALTDDECLKLSRAFDENVATKPRSDGVGGQVLGAYHYQRTFEQYSKEVEGTRDAVNAFLSAADDPVAGLLEQVQRAVRPDGITVRPATWHNLGAAKARALSWTEAGTYLLAPHEDVGQLVYEPQIGFEAQMVASNVVVAVNIYPRVPEGGGNLRIWNRIPNSEARTHFGTTGTGYPYPVEELDEYDFVDVHPTTGSIVLSNGGLVHAVTGYQDTPSAGRLLVNFFLGLINPSTIVHWV